RVGLWVIRVDASCCDISCPTSWLRSWYRRHSRSPLRSSPKRRCRFSVSASSRPRRAGAACSTPPPAFSRRRRGWRCGRVWRSSAWCCRSTCSATDYATPSTHAGISPAVLARLWDNILLWRRATAVLATLSLALLVAAVIAREPPDFSAMPVIAIVRDGEQHPVWAIRLARSAHQIAADSLRPQIAPSDHVYQLWLLASDAGA